MYIIVQHRDKRKAGNKINTLRVTVINRTEPYFATATVDLATVEQGVYGAITRGDFTM